MRDDADKAFNAVDDDQFGGEAAAQTLDQFIARVIEAAKSRDEFDPTLLAILTSQVVKEDVAEEAVALCVAQIEALAEQRAAAPKQEPHDGRDNA